MKKYILAAVIGVITATVVGYIVYSHKKPAPIMCTTEFRSGLGLTINDPTGKPVTGATITTNPATEPFRELTPGHYAGIGEGRGTYTFTITKNGFALYTDSVTLQHDACHVESQSRAITLTPSTR